VEFRQAPEHPFPAALEDTVGAFHWAAENTGSIGGDARKLALGGDSAGANLAVVAANRISAAGEEVRPAALMLLYPVMDHPSAGHASYKERGTGCGLEASLMEWFWEQYAAGVAPENGEISPLRLKALPALPPTLVATAEYDPLRDEGVKFAEKLAAAGVAVTNLHAEDMHHNFPVHPGTVMRFPQSVAALREIAGWLKRALDA
jgi:acetyl esterase/lipase